MGTGICHSASCSATCTIVNSPLPLVKEGLSPGCAPGFEFRWYIPEIFSSFNFEPELGGLGLRSGFESPGLDRPGRLPHQQGLCEARLGYRDGSPQLGAPGPESRGWLLCFSCFIRTDVECCIGYRGFPQGSPRPSFAHPRRELRRAPLFLTDHPLLSPPGPPSRPARGRRQSARFKLL